MRRRFALLFALIVLLALGVGIYFALPSIFGSVVAPLPSEYQNIIREKSGKYNVDSCFIAAVINGESRWIPTAGSHAGAQGLMQLIPGTASAISRVANIPYSNRNQLHDPNINIELGTALLRYNIDHYGSLRNVLVAYNAGGGRVRLPNNLLPRETQGYITKITRYYELYATLYPDFCTGPSLIGRATNPQQAAPDLPDFVPPPAEAPVDLSIENFWKSLITQE